MRSGIYSTSEAADHSEASVSQLIGKFLSRFRSVMGRTARSDDANGVMIALGQLTPDIEHNRRRMDLAQWFRIVRRFRRNYFNPDLANPLQFCREIDQRFPRCDLLRDLRSDALDRSQLISFRAEYAFRRTEYLQQPTHPHWADGWKHVEGNTSFRGIHYRYASKIPVLPS